LPGSAEALVRRGRKTKYLLIAYFSDIAQWMYVIQILVKDLVRTKSCTSILDPHMKTFDSV